MRFPSLALLICCIGLCACTSLGTAPQSLDVRLAAQNSLFEEQYQSDLRLHPERATAYGDYRYNDRLAEYSLAANESQHALDVDFLARLRAIRTEGFPEQDSLSHEVMVRELQRRSEDYGFKEFEMPVNQMDGPQLRLADLPLSVPLDSVKHYEDYIARLHQIPRVFGETEEVLRAGVRDQLMPVRFLLEKVPGECEGVIASDPFLRPTDKYPADIAAAEQQRLTAEINKAVADEVLPAYRQFEQFIAAEYAPHGRSTLTVASLPGGEKRYRNAIRSRTTVENLSPGQIHRIGLAEIERIEADMLAIARREGFEDLQSFRDSLKRNPKYKPASAEQILDDFRKYIAQMQPKLPELSANIP